MARGVNKAIIIGHCGRDPQVAYSTGGTTIVNLSLATTEKWTDRNSGQPVERTEWHRVVIFGKLAEIAAQYIKKGSQVYIEGRLQTRKYTGRDNIEKYTTEIVANELEMLGSAGRSDPNQDQRQPPADRPASGHQAAPANTPPADGFDDIPF